MKLAQGQYAKTRKSIVLVQSACRRFLAIKSAVRERAATRIQAWWKGVKARREFLKKKRACNSIEQYYKLYLARKTFLNQRSAAIQIQGYKALMNMKLDFNSNNLPGGTDITELFVISINSRPALSRFKQPVVDA